jgi:hypothetical protein
MKSPKEHQSQTLSPRFTDAQLAEIVLLRAKGLEWAEVCDKLNNKFDCGASIDAVKRAWSKYGNFFESDSPTVRVAELKEIQRVKRSNSRTARENRDILDYVNAKEQLLSGMKAAVAELAKLPPVMINKIHPSGKKRMTMELLVGDLHLGQKTPNYNLVKARARLREMTAVVLKEVVRNSKLYDVHRLIVAFLGDLIASATMHGLDSARGCEVGNSEQVVLAIKWLFADVLMPLAQTGLDIDVPAVTGNHDRAEAYQTMYDPGANNLTWIIYNTLEEMCRARGLTNVRFHIVRSGFVTLPIYSDTALYEHGDLAKGVTRDCLETWFNKRQTQLKKILTYFRLGHWHEAAVYGRGRIVVNPSLMGSDSYAELKGFASEASQVLNYYVDTKDRPTTFYRSFPIWLEGV